MTLIHQLNALESSGLIRLAQAPPEMEYLFRHALIQDAAYASLVKRDRMQLHRAVGEALERAYPGWLASGELAPVLGHHFYAAGDEGRALTYFALAGDAAARVYANTEAAMYYSRAIELARRAPDVESERLIHLYGKRGRALELSDAFDQALANYFEMEALARERADRAMELAALIPRATLHATTTPLYHAGKALALSEQALTLARVLGDRVAEAKTLWNLMLVHIYGEGGPRHAVDYGERSLAIARELNLREQMAFTLSDLGWAYLGIGQLTRAQAALEEAHELWRELGNLPMLANSLNLSSMPYYLLGEYTQTLGAADEGYRIGQLAGNLWSQLSGLMVRSLVYVEYGEFDKAIDALDVGVRLGEQAGLTLQTAMGRAHLGWVYGLLGAYEQGLALLRKVELETRSVALMFRPWILSLLSWVEISRGYFTGAQAAIEESSKLVSMDSLASPAPVLILLVKVQLALARNDYSRAVADLDEHLPFFELAGVRQFLADLLRLKAQALLAQYRAEAAWQVLSDARAIAAAIGSRRSLWPILFALSQIEAQRGNLAESKDLRRQAHEIVTQIAGGLSTPALRESFLKLPEVRAVYLD